MSLNDTDPPAYIVVESSMSGAEGYTRGILLLSIRVRAFMKQGYIPLGGLSHVIHTLPGPLPGHLNPSYYHYFSQSMLYKGKKADPFLKFGFLPPKRDSKGRFTK